MDCRSARDWLLQAEDPCRLDDGPEGLAGHVVNCSLCRRQAHVLGRLEAGYRDQPLPAAADRAREAFLRRLPPPVPVSTGRHWRAVRSRWALAAAVLLLAGSAVWLSLPSPEAVAKPDLVGQLIDWNLDLTRAADARDRQEAGLRQAVRQADLPDDDRDLAEVLLQTGTRLAAAVDPMDQADHFNDLADKLVSMIDDATTKKDEQRLRQLADCYCRVAEDGIYANLERAGNDESLNPTSKKKKERVLKSEARRAARLRKLMDKLPKASQKQIRRALDPARKANRSKKTRKH
jgi:hypothetical protein